MPVVITFDIEGAPTIERNRIQSFFERFGWENLGGSSYRYPRLGTDDQPVEDWFNHVIPALMLFRTYLIDSERVLSKFTLDVHSSTGYNYETGFGRPPTNTEPDLVLYDTPAFHFGKQNLLNWLTGIAYAYEVGDAVPAAAGPVAPQPNQNALQGPLPPKG